MNQNKKFFSFITLDEILFKNNESIKKKKKKN